MKSIAERYFINLCQREKYDIAVLFAEQCKELAGTASIRRALMAMSVEYAAKRALVIARYLRPSGEISAFMMRDFGMWYQYRLVNDTRRASKKRQALIRYMRPINQHPEARELLERILPHPHSRAQLGDLQMKKTEELMKCTMRKSISISGPQAQGLGSASISSKAGKRGKSTQKRGGGSVRTKS